jgi:tetratricopeptide (TPR) repeat protein
MFSFRIKYCAVLLVAVVCGCASAEKRFEQGYEAEGRGQYEEAVMRYAQAIEKDSSLDEAKIHLREVGNLAITERMEDADEWISRGDPVGSAAHLHRLDGVVTRARGVGVRLAVPENYLPRRREIFDEAFDTLVDRGTAARRQGRWQEGLKACSRARQEFEPSLEQRNRALTEESTIFMQWSESEYERGHLRNAFEVAANVNGLEWSPAEQSTRAALLMEDALLEGEVELIVLPVRARPSRRKLAAAAEELAAQTEAVLRRGPWRNPPAFVQVHESLAVRDLVTRAGILDGDELAATLALILRLAEADFAAHVQLLDTESTEFNVKSRTQNVQTRAGGSATFTREEGTRRIQTTARVLIADGFGNEIANVIVPGSGTAPFARGVFDGDPKKLNLDSRQVDLFDHFVLEAQEQAARDALVGDLSANIANAVFQATLAQVP